MRIAELSLGKLTLIERVYGPWAFVFCFITVYLLFWRMVEVSNYQWVGLFFLNKLFGFKSKCNKKLYWEGRRIATFKVENIIVLLTFATAFVVGGIGAAYLSLELGNRSQQLAIWEEFKTLTVLALRAILLSTMISTFVIGSAKLLKQKYLYSHHLPGSGPPLGSKETAQEPSCKKRILSMWSAFASGSAQFMRQFQLV